MPTRGGGPPVRKSIPHIKRVIAVASGKGGVGKSTIVGTNGMLHCFHPILKLLYSKSRHLVRFEQVWPQTITCWPPGPRHFWPLDTEVDGLRERGGTGVDKGRACTPNRPVIVFCTHSFTGHCAAVQLGHWCLWLTMVFRGCPWYFYCPAHFSVRDLEEKLGESLDECQAIRDMPQLIGDTGFVDLDSFPEYALEAGKNMLDEV
jgi:hypothetical protein